MADQITIEALEKLAGSLNTVAMQQVQHHAEIKGDFNLLIERVNTIDGRGCEKGAVHIDALRAELKAGDEVLHARVDSVEDDNKTTNKRFDGMKNMAYLGSIISGAIGAVAGWLSFKH